MLHDVRLAARLLRKRPGFTVVAALTLALGIGAPAAVFSLMEGVLLTPPPYRDPQRLVLVPSVRVDSQQVERLEPTPAIQWMDWQKQATSFDGIAAYYWTFNFLVDADGSESLAGMGELRAVDPTVAVEHLKTLDQIRSDSLASRIFAQRLLVGFSIVGTLLTVVGVYGVLALSVASRRREIAIRTAVGARRRDIHNLVFGEGFRLVAGGIVAGIAGALAMSRVLQSLLFEVAPTDPVTIGAAVLLFASVTLIACWAPTRRAAAVDPLEALRCE